MTPPALDRVVKRCLAKEPDKRWQTASDLCEELKWIAEGGSQVRDANCRSERHPCRSGDGAGSWSWAACLLAWLSSPALRSGI